MENIKESIVRGMTLEEHEKWKQKVCDEQKKASKNLIRELKIDQKQKSNEDEKIINKTFALNSDLFKSCGTFT